MSKRRKIIRPAAPKPRFPDWLPQVLGLAALAFAVYANAITNGFVSDDRFQLLRNPLVTNSGMIRRILESGVWSFLGAHGNYYRPLQFLAYRLLYLLAGFSAPAFHLSMVLLHVGNTLLAYFLVRRMAAWRVALAAAALFAVHPIHTEVVDWIAALPDLLVTTVVLLGLLAFARQDAAPRGLRIPGHCVLYMLALLSKETGVMLLPLYAGFGFFCLGRRWNEFRRNALLYLAMAATFGVYLAMRIHALGSLAPAQQIYFRLGPADYLLSVVVTAAHYLWALVWPANLNFFHVFHPTQSVTAAFLISALALAAVGAGFLRSRTALVSYGILWVALTLAPPLNLTGLGKNVFAERYLYLPSVGFCWIAGWAWDWLARRQARWAAVAGGVLLLACAARTAARNQDWRDNFTLVRVTVAQSPTAGLMRDAMAEEYVQRDAYDKALAEERLAVRYEPDLTPLRTKLAYLLLDVAKDPQAALAEFQKAEALEPTAARTHCDLGVGFEAVGDTRQAAREYLMALQLRPDFQEAKDGYNRTR